MILRFYLNNVSRLLKKHYLCIKDILYICEIYMNIKLSLFLYAYKLFIPKCLPLDSVRLLLYPLLSLVLYVHRIQESLQQLKQKYR